MKMSLNSNIMHCDQLYNINTHLRIGISSTPYLKLIKNMTKKTRHTKQLVPHGLVYPWNEDEMKMWLNRKWTRHQLYPIVNITGPKKDFPPTGLHHLSQLPNVSRKSITQKWNTGIIVKGIKGRPVDTGAMWVTFWGLFMSCFGILWISVLSSSQVEAGIYC